jgi:hypothetical protein
MSSQEEPEDQPPADQTAEDQPSPEAENADEQPSEDRPPETAGGDDDDDDGKPPTEDERIEALTERIEKARTKAEDAGVIDDPDAEEYVESGASEEEDDQTIAPPG